MENPRIGLSSLITLVNLLGQVYITRVGRVKGTRDSDDDGRVGERRELPGRTGE